MEGSESGEADFDANRRSRRLKTMKLHVSLVDEIERGLTRAMRAYREHAEEALARHLVNLENDEARRDMELAKLRAENCRLRDALGIKNSAESSCAQTVLFQETALGKEMVPAKRNSMCAPAPKRTATVSINPASLKRGASKVGSFVDDTFLNSPKISKQMTQAGGAWEYFVAWVPNGAFLKSPDPWIPLPQDFQMPKGGAEVPPLPGMIAPEVETLSERKRTKEKSVEDPDSSDSDRDAEDREPYTVLKAWKVSQRQLERLKKGGGSSEFLSRCDYSSSGESSENGDDTFKELPSSKHCCIIHPHSNMRMAWDIGSLIMVVYDMIMIPMGFFPLPQNLFLTIMVWTTRVFWTIDIGWSMCTAITLADGKINFSFRYILKRYLKTWFGFDVIIVSSDWLVVILQSSSVVGLGRLARGFRITRVLRLLRLVRMQEVMRMLMERIQSDKLSFLLCCIKMMLFVLVSSHILACLWWAVGMHEDGEGASWIRSSGYMGMDVGHQYLVSMRFALMQFSGGMNEIMPVTSLEHFCAMVCGTLGFASALCISSILTSNMTHQILVGGAHSRQMVILRRYLKQNKVGSNLVLQVQRSVQHAGEDDLAPENVELLAVVAEPLRVEISYQIFSGIMRHHSLFSDYCSTDPNVVRRICHLAVSMMLLDKGDVVFTKGEKPLKPKMYFVFAGLLEYCTHGEPVMTGEKQWLSEANLWTVWTHRGVFSALTRGKVAALDSQMFQELVQKFRSKAGYDVRLYASEFIKFLNEKPKADDLTCMVV